MVWFRAQDLLLKFVVLVVVIRSAEDRHSLDALAEVAWLFEDFVVIFPVGELDVLD